jgi:hypothetical protein
VKRREERGPEDEGVIEDGVGNARRFEDEGALRRREPEVHVGAAPLSIDARARRARRVEAEIAEARVIGGALDPRRDHAALSEEREEARGTSQGSEEADPEAEEIDPREGRAVEAGAAAGDARGGGRVVADEDGAVARGEERLARGAKVAARRQRAGAPRGRGVEGEEGEGGAARLGLQRAVQDDDVGHGGGAIESRLPIGRDEDGRATGERSRGEQRLVAVAIEGGFGAGFDDGDLVRGA